MNGPDRRLLDDIDGVVWEAEASTDSFRYTFVSGRAEAILGYPASRWLVEPGFWTSRIHPDDRERVVHVARETARLASRSEIDYRAMTADGRTLWVRDRLLGVAGVDGHPPMLRGLLVDISEHRQAEERLQTSEARTSAILMGALDCIVTIDHRGDVLDFNPAAERTFGFQRADVIGRPMVDLIIPPRHRADHRRGFARYLETEEERVIGRRLEMSAVGSDGVEFPVELTITRVAGSQPPVFTGFLRDITDRRNAEAELRGTLSLLSATLESTADGILVVDQTGKIVSLNRRFAAMWRIPQEILESRDDDQAIAFVLSQLKEPDAFVAKVRDLYARTDEESFDVLEFKDGRVFERYSMPQKIDERSVGRVWSFRDVTARKEAEAALRKSEDQLRQSQKMDAIGRLAGGVAHDFNNLLTVILGYGEQMLERLQPGDPQRRAAEEIQNAAERAAALTRQLLAFSRRQMLEPRSLDLNRIAAGTAEMLNRLIGEDIALEVELDPSLGSVLADEHQMQQVIMNLAINARDAMPRGGRLTLATANADVDDTDLVQHLPLPPGRYVTLLVGDTGIGMDAETLARIFEPFFTTKELGKGTGLGLATVYGIVRQTGGYIWVDSEPGQGAVFRVYLPRHDAPSPAGAGEVSSAASEPLPCGHETVLLVEDEAMVRELMRGTLERQGYRVLSAGSGSEALLVASAHGGPLNLLVTDVVMPGMRGPDLAARLVPAHPRLRVLYMSGYADDAALRHGVREGQAAFLQKPFTRGALARKVRAVLDARQTA
jgi:two-component system, cell cycle sensor histidine kinase and response regulator CckA